MTTTRFQMDIDESQISDLERLMEAGGLRTRKELFNVALTLLNWVAKEWQAGRSIVSLDETKRTIKELDMPIRAPIQKSSKLRLV